MKMFPKTPYELVTIFCSIGNQCFQCLVVAFEEILSLCLCIWIDSPVFLLYKCGVSLDALFHLTFSMEKYYGEDSMSLLREIPAFLYDDFMLYCANEWYVSQLAKGFYLSMFSHNDAMCIFHPGHIQSGIRVIDVTFFTLEGIDLNSYHMC